MRLALYQPEIPGNVCAMLRLAACLRVGVDLIEPCGFVLSDARMRRAGMDYIDHVSITRHPDWFAFLDSAPARLVLLSTKAEAPFHDFRFEPDDTLLFGQESAGVPDSVRDACGAAVRIPIDRNVRSLNVSMAAGIGLAEALRQTGQWPQ